MLQQPNGFNLFMSRCNSIKSLNFYHFSEIRHRTIHLRSWLAFIYFYFIQHTTFPVHLVFYNTVPWWRKAFLQKLFIMQRVVRQVEWVSEWVIHRKNNREMNVLCHLLKIVKVSKRMQFNILFWLYLLLAMSDKLDADATTSSTSGE